MAVNSSASQPAPTPSSTRPPDSTSREVTARAVTNGCRRARTYTAVPSWMVDVAAAIDVSTTHGSCSGVSSGNGNDPSGLYGYGLSTCAGKMTWSGTKTDP